MSSSTQNGDWLSTLSTTLQTQILEKMEPQNLKNGDYLYRVGDAAKYLYLVTSGYLYLKSTSANGNEVVLAIYGPNRWVGEVPVMSHENRSFDAIALGDTQVSALNQEDFDQLCTEHPEIQQQLTAKLFRIIKGLLTCVEESALLPLSQRLAKLLLLTAQSYGTPRNEGIQIDMPITQANMGKMLGVTRQSIQRELKILQDNKIINRIEGYWIVRDMEALHKSTDCSGQ